MVGIKEIILDGKKLHVLEEDAYKDFISLREYILDGKLDERALVLTGPYRCDNRWIFTKERDEALEEAAVINEAYKEEFNHLKEKYEQITRDYYELLEKHNERRSLLDKILGR